MYVIVRKLFPYESLNYQVKTWLADFKKQKLFWNRYGTSCALEYLEMKLVLLKFYSLILV